MLGRLASVPAYFALRIASALLLLKLSATWLPVGGFTVFAQFLLWAALLNMLAVGGTQNGLVRQAAAAPDGDALARTTSAGYAIWKVAGPLLFVPVALGSSAISALLTGSRNHPLAVVAIALLALAAGPGQIWCSLLTGRKRTVASLVAQALGLAAGTGAAAWRLAEGDAPGAAIGFAAGPLVTMGAAFALTRSLVTAGLRPARPEVAALLRYSAAFAATTGFTALTLFALRALYRGAAGEAALGYWMAANRISDMSTQLLGLFLIQLVVPHLATCDDEAGRRRFLLRCWALGAAATGSALLVFSLASEPLVRLFLSEAYLPAVPAIRFYMAGDTLRVWAALAMFAAFARGHPGRYAAIEIATVAVMAVITVMLIQAGNPRAPMLGYAIAYGLAAAAVTLAFAARRPR